MLDKIKKVLDIIKGSIFLIAAPIFGIVAYIFYLKKTISSLDDEVAQSKVEKQLADVLSKKEKANEEANTAESNYIDARNEYLSGQESGKL